MIQDRTDALAVVAFRAAAANGTVQAPATGRGAAEASR